MQQWLFFLSDNPILRLLQLALLGLGIIAVFLVCFTTRDILLRTRSFWYQLLSILVVACLPVAGFFLYLLFRPSWTLKDREMEDAIAKLVKFTEEAEIVYEEEIIVPEKPKKADRHHHSHSVAAV